MIIWEIQFFFNLHLTFRFALKLDRECGVRRCVHLHLIPVFIRNRVLILLIVMQPLDRVISRSVIARFGETIRLSGDGNRGRIRRPSSVPVRTASRRIYSVVTAVETMKFNAANLHANPRGINPASVYLAPGCV